MSDYGSFRRHAAAVPFELVMLGGAVSTLLRGDWKYLAISLFTFGVSFLPLVAERLVRIKIPASFQVTYVVFVFSSMFLGEVFAFYHHVSVWDDVLHFLSGFLISFSVMLLLALFAHNRKHIIMPAWFGSLFIFCSAIAMAALWEVTEFTSDQLFGTFSQGKSLYDTMMDIIYALFGGLIVAVTWVLHTANKKVFIISRLIVHFERLNKDTR